MQKRENKVKKRIRQISVTDLFGVFNHTIPLNLDDRVTIIAGPNGFGKTMMLKLLTASFSKNDDFLRTVPFREFRVDFEDNTGFWITKFPSEYEVVDYGEDAGDVYEIPTPEEITFYTINEVPISQSLKTRQSEGHESVASTQPQIEILRELTLDDYSIVIPPDTYENVLYAKNYDKRTAWIAEAREAVSVHLIETQRLLNLSQRIRQNKQQEKQLAPTVKMYSRKLATTIKASLAEYASLSQKLDRTFPERAFNPVVKPANIDEKNLRSKLIELEQKRSLLMSAGLLDQGGPATFELGDHIDDSKKIMLAVYIEDTQQKLSVFDTLFEKIHLLTTIINNRFLYKQMTVNKDQGFVFTTSKNMTLSLESLSSGEQHELVLFFELLFNIEPGSLILIDEPELSLHVVWQQQFINDVQNVTRISDIDILMATHSPDLIDNHWDLVVQLEGPSK